MTEETKPEQVRSEDMLSIGMSYRQLDYWTGQGYIRPIQEKPGSGYPRLWPRAEFDIARVIVRLLGVGVELAAAARIAREAIESGQKRVDLGGGVVLSLEDAA